MPEIPDIVLYTLAAIGGIATLLGLAGIVIAFVAGLTARPGGDVYPLEHHSTRLHLQPCLECRAALLRIGGDDQGTDYRCPRGHHHRAEPDISFRIPELDGHPSEAA